MTWPVLVQAVRPTARAVAWTPLVGAVAALGAVVAVSHLLDGRTGPLTMLVVAALAAVTVDALDDPGERLLAAMPVSALPRGVLRAVLVAAPASVALVAFTTLLPGTHDTLLLPGLALVLAGLAVAAWAPGERGARVAAALPAAWVVLELVVGDSRSAAAEVAGWWHTEPLAVGVTALAALVLRSRR